MNTYTVTFVENNETQTKTVEAYSPTGAIIAACAEPEKAQIESIRRADPNLTERLRMVKAMEYICRNINDMDVFDGWLMSGVADGDIRYGDLSDDGIEDLDYYISDDKTFADLMGCFLRRMVRAKKSGGLYCDGVVDSSEEGIA